MKQKTNHRQNLISLSASVRPLVEMGVYDSVNEAIVEVYKKENEEITELHTFLEWKDKGYRVKKGEKAFPIWGRKRKAKKTVEKEGEEEEKEFKFFPVCYLFADNQVEPI